MQKIRHIPNYTLGWRVASTLALSYVCCLCLQAFATQCNSNRNVSVTDPLLRRVKKIDVADENKKAAKAHFSETGPIILLPDEFEGELETEALGVRLMSLNFEHLMPNYYQKRVWESKLVAHGKTLYAASPDVVAAIEIYKDGMDVFGTRILKELGYDWILDEEGGKQDITGLQVHDLLGNGDRGAQEGFAIGGMSNGLIYNRNKFKVIDTRSIPLDIPNAVPRTRNIFRVTLNMHIGGPEIVIYVIHFKSGRTLNTPIELPDGKGSITTSDQLRWHQMDLLKRLIQADMSPATNTSGDSTPRHVIAMGDFNTAFYREDIVSPHKPSEKMDPSSDDLDMIESSEPLRSFVSDHGIDAFLDVDSYTHVYRGKGNNLDRVLVFPANGDTRYPLIRIQDRRVLRYPWQLDDKGLPMRTKVSDHLPLSVDVYFNHRDVEETAQ